MVTFNDQQYTEAVLFIAWRSEKDERSGAIKLSKILFFSDFEAFRRNGRPITGATYQHLDEGPAPREHLRIQSQLIEDDLIEFETRTYFNQVQKRLITKRPPDLTVFDLDELRIIESVTDELRELNATQASDLSHREYGFLLTEAGESIPYESALLSPQPLSAEKLEAGRRMAAQYQDQA